MSEELTIGEARKLLRKRLGVKDNMLAGFGSKQPNTEETLFTNHDLEAHNLIAPPYDPHKLKRIKESCGKLGTCIEIYVSNIEGYGYEFKYLGDKQDEKSTEVVAERKALEGFFKQVNEFQSFTALRKQLRRDYEETGSGYIEIVRYNTTGDIALLYRADPVYMRLQAKQPDPVEIKVDLMRNGKLRKTNISKRFRRFAMRVNAAKQIRFFKEYGDPRRMDALTGTYEKIYDKNQKKWINNPAWQNLKQIEEATEILHLKQGNDIYGIPRWAGMASVVLGISSADYVNYDLFESNAIPALAVLVSGGRLTADSVEDIASVLESQRGSENWHKIAILEAVGGDDGNIDDKSTTARVDFKELNKPTDAEFGSYLKQSEKRLQATFRLPPLLSGEAEEYSRSCYSAGTQTLTENGWKYYWEIQKDEKIATFDPNTNEMQYHLPQGEILLYPYKGKMVEFKNNNSDICVTPDHTMWAQPSYSHCPFRKFEAKDFLDNTIGKRYFKHAPDTIEQKDDLKSFPIPFESRSDTLIPPKTDFRHIDGDEFIEFLGYFLGDGSTYAKKNQYCIALGAHKERKKIEFVKYGEIFKYKYEMNVCYSDDKNFIKKTMFISDKGFRNWLRNNCGENAKTKKIPDDFMHLNQRQSKILLDAIIFTDGTRSKKENETNFSLSTTSKILADQAQILGIKCGYRAQISLQRTANEKHNDVYRVSFVEKTWSQIQREQIKEIDYDGMVYCFEVPNHLFFTRRNGKIAIQGNTSDSSKLVTEDQVFIPERREFDEPMNLTFLKDLNAKYYTLYTIGPRLLEGAELIDAIGKLARANALSTNQAIRLSNRILDLDTPPYDASWADIPVASLFELLKKNHITEIEGVGGEEIQKAAGQVKEVLSSKEFDTVSEDLEEVKDQLDQIFSLVAQTE